jgi:hypothetical protein
VPEVRRKEPGPPEDVARLEGFNGDSPLSWDKHLEGDSPMTEEVELIRGLSFAKEIGARCKAHVRRTPRHEPSVVGINILKERVLS